MIPLSDFYPADPEQICHGKMDIWFYRLEQSKQHESRNRKAKHWIINGEIPEAKLKEGQKLKH